MNRQGKALEPEFDYLPVEVNVWGEFACFTRPEMKVERLSYRCMTPSAARGILEAIFWKPQFNWIVQEIAILNPVQQISLRRNEVNSKIPASKVSGWRERQEHDRYFADVDNTQRNTIALKNVNYVIKANLALGKEFAEIHPAKFRDQFRRRVERGQCYLRPYLGCREFAANFAPPPDNYRPINLTEDLGRVVFDFDYRGEDRAIPHFFQARIEEGVLDVPVRKYAEIRDVDL